MSRLRDERGVSMLEVVVATALIVVVLLPVLRFFDSAVSGANELQRSTFELADDRLTIDTLVREVRQAYSGVATQPPVVVPDPQSMTVLTPDTSTPYRLRQIDYRVHGAWLERRVTTSNESSCPTTAASCAGYGPPFTFPTPRAWTPVLRVGSGSFVLTSTAGVPRTVRVTLAGANSTGRADRTFTTTVELRNT